MKRIAFVGVAGILLLLACQKPVVSSADDLELTQASNRMNQSPIAEADREVWEPTAIAECMSKVNVGEPFDLESSINPFYLRANLDSNELVDYAVLIKGKNTKTRGVVVCKDSLQPFVYGEIAKSSPGLSKFENDNFVTSEWEISTKDFTKKRVNSAGEPVAPNAKGESVSFSFEGGGVTIFWDGRQFRLSQS